MSRRNRLASKGGSARQRSSSVSPVTEGTCSGRSSATGFPRRGIVTRSPAANRSSTWQGVVPKLPDCHLGHDPDCMTSETALCRVSPAGSRRTVSSDVPEPESTIIRIDVSEFTFPADAPRAGKAVVVAYLIRHPDAIVLFDTGIGLGPSELDERYHPRPRPITHVLAEQSLRVSDIDVVVNCHPHAGHAGQNAAFPGIPIYVQPAEWHLSEQADYTIEDWLGRGVADYRPVEGDHDALPGVRTPPPPGATPA